MGMKLVLFIGSPIAKGTSGDGIRIQHIPASVVVWAAVCRETVDFPVCNDFCRRSQSRVEDGVPELIDNVPDRLAIPRGRHCHPSGVAARMSFKAATAASWRDHISLASSAIPMRPLLSASATIDRCLSSKARPLCVQCI